MFIKLNKISYILLLAKQLFPITIYLEKLVLHKKIIK